MQPGAHGEEPGSLGVGSPGVFGRCPQRSAKATALRHRGAAGNENKAARPPSEGGRSEPQETAESAKLSVFFSPAQQFCCHGKQKMCLLIPSRVCIVLSSGSGLWGRASSFWLCRAGEGVREVYWGVLSSPAPAPPGLALLSVSPCQVPSFSGFTVVMGDLLPLTLKALHLPTQA